MLNEEKIRLMTKAASFEAKEGKKALAMNKYFRGDYISLNMIAAWLSYTVAYLLCAGLWAFYRMDYFMENLHKMDLVTLGRNAVLIYLLFLVVFLTIHYLVYHLRYQENKKKLTAYHKILKRISHIYQTEGKSGNSELTAEGVRENDNLTGN